MSFKIEAEEKLKWIGVVAYPHMKKHDADKLAQSYKQASYDMIELVVDNDDYSGIQQLKGMM